MDRHDQRPAAVIPAQGAVSPAQNRIPAQAGIRREAQCTRIASSPPARG